MPTVTDENGVEHEVVQVEGVATIASLGNFSELPVGSAQFIEQAMAAAVNKAYEEGVTDPGRVKERMMSARADAKKAILAREVEA